MADQKVTTYYDEAKKREAGEKHHAERRELNRKLRKEQEPVTAKVKRVAEKTRDIIAPTAKRIGNAAGRVVDYAAERGRGLEHETRDIRRPRKQNYGGSLPMGGGGFNGGGDLFGMRNMGNPFAPPRPEPAPRRKKRRKARAAPRRSAPQRSGGMDMMGIPKHMRWMF